MISPLGEDAALHIANLQSSFAEDAFFDADEYTEKVQAPPVGQELTFSRGPLVEGTLSLYRASDNFLYTPGLDYFEVPQGGMENVRIPEGAQLRAEYVYQDTVPLRDAPIQPEPGETSSGPRYATLVKMGAS